MNVPCRTLREHSINVPDKAYNTFLATYVDFDHSIKGIAIVQPHTDLCDAQPFRVREHPSQLHGLPGNAEVDVFEGGGSARAGPGRDHDVVDVDVQGSRPCITLVHRCEQRLSQQTTKRQLVRCCVTSQGPLSKGRHTRRNQSSHYSGLCVQRHDMLHTSPCNQQ